MTTEQIKNKIKYGDYGTLGQILSINPEAAKRRFFRGDKNAADILIKIIENREKLISELSQ